MNHDHQTFQERRVSTHDYHGSSMYPTLRPGDGLIVTPYPTGESVLVGDVVLFYDPSQGLNVVHRVISIKPQGIHTHGDHNAQADAIRLQTADIIGKVTQVIRKNKTWRIQNGWPGHVLGIVFRTKTVWRIYLLRRLHPAYFRLAQSGFCHIPPQWLGLRVFTFQRPNGIEIHLRLWNRWTIGVYTPGQRQWRLRPPFRVFLDENALQSPSPNTLERQP